MKITPKYLAFSFIFPFVILGAVFALNGVYPFGGRQILVHDFLQQHYPFLSDLWHKVRAGSPGLPGSPSLLGGVAPWSWTAGGGHDYAALTAYYMASPLNLLAFTLPHAWLREALTVILLLKIGCAGLFMGIFLRGAFWQDKLALQGGLVGQGRLVGQYWPALPFFSTLYALCAFTLGYYWNIMWFDSFALLPLVALGVLRLANEGKYRLYTVSLALAVFTNYYMGLYICVFAAITFFSQCVIQKFKARDFLRRLALIAACSVLAIGMAAVVIIPAFSALRSGYSMATGAFPNKISLYNNFFDVLGNFIAFTPPTVTEGLPNLYCGMISILLAGLFIYSPEISRREKIALTGTLVFLLISCNLNALYYLWNGFRFPIKMPGRFSFLISFILIVMAYRAYLLTEHMNRRSLLAMGISAAVFLLAAVFGSQEKGYIIGSAVLCAVYLPLFYFAGLSTRVQRFIRTALLLVIVTELSATSYIAIKKLGLTGRDKYPDRYEQMQSLLALRRPSGDPMASPSGERTGVDFYRTDIDQSSTSNDPLLYNYNGISFFSSTIDAHTVGFMQGLGLWGGGTGNNLITYNKASPLINAFLNMRYLISRESNPSANDIYWETVSKTSDLLLQENKRYLPLGFMADEGITGYKHHAGNPFLSQNDLFRRAAGLNAGLFTVTELSGDTPAMKFDRENKSIWDYEMPSDGIFYVYCRNDKLSGTAAMFVNGNLFQQFRIYKSMPYILTAGSFSQGDIISFGTDNNTLIYTGLLNSEIFEQGYKLLADETLRLTKFTDTQVNGNVTALKNGVLYTSIPGRNWTVYVDGVKDKLLLIDNAMAAVRLEKGAHEIEFRYYNKSLLAGIIISLVSLAVFAALALLRRLNFRKIT